MDSRSLGYLALMVFGSAIALYFAISAFGCTGAGLQQGSSGCFSEFHVGTAIFVLGLVIAFFGFILFYSNRGRRGY